MTTEPNSVATQQSTATSSTNPQIMAPASTMNSTPIGEFNPEVDEWILYRERLDIFFNTCGGVDEDRKKNLLLNCIGATAYKLVRDLSTPVMPSTKTYTELCEMLSSFYTPPVVSFKERKQFYAAKKDTDETIVQYVARLKFLAGSCDFGNRIESILMDKFVTSLDGRIFDRLCEENHNEITLARAILLASKYESTTTNIDINSMKSNQRFDKSNNKKKFIPGSKNNSSNNSSNNNSSSNSGTDSTAKKQRCKHCGYKTHLSENCKYKSATCHKCSRVGHLASICKQRTINTVSEQNNVKLNDMTNIFTIKTDIDNSLCANVKVNNIFHKFMLDSGAGISAIPLKDFNTKFKKFHKLDKSDLILQAYSGHNIEVIGQFNSKVEFNNKINYLRIMVVNSDGPSILGRDFLEKFKISFSEINSINNPLSLPSLLKKFDNMFEDKLGRYKHKQVSLRIDDSVSPKFFKPRPIPSAFKTQVDDELNRLERMGVITPVETSDWGTPLVPVLKSDGGIRICADYKVTINQHLTDDKHPIPRVEEIFCALQGGLTFSKLDLMSAYNQLELDEKSRNIVAWSTHRGVYLVNRLPFGVKPATGIFQRELEKLLLGIPGVVNFLDDIVITGTSHQDHLSNLNKVFHRLSDAGFQLKKNKCVFFEKEIKFLGHILNKNGLSKTDERIADVLNTPNPSNITELRAFAGLVNYYGKFIQNLATKMHPLYRLLQKDVKFNWNNDCQVSFKCIKNEIAKDVVLSHFNPKLPIVLTCDASSYGIGGILSHILPNGDDRPIAFCSRTLSKAENNYSVIDKEALAIVFSCKKFYYYLIGNHFILKTDHKPLLRIFGENSGIPQMAASRIQRWACTLAGFNYTIKYTKGENNSADSLSRLPSKTVLDIPVEKNYLNFISDQNFNVDFQAVKRLTTTDPVLSKVFLSVQSGNFDLLKNDDNFKSFCNRKNELTIEHGVVMWGYRAIIPFNLRQAVLRSIHCSHLGIVKCKALARSFVWWPGIDADIEHLIKSCTSCSSVRPDPPKSTLIPWEIPKGVWSRIHIDFAGPMNNEYFFIITDAFSKWPEVFRTRDITSSFTVNKLREVFARFGLPDTIVSDNGTQFTSVLFQEFVERNKIVHKTSPPGHPATNGAAENSVKSFKNGLKAAIAHGEKNLDVIIQRYLFDYRVAPHSTTGESPAKLMFGRTPRTRFDFIRPNSVHQKLSESACTQAEYFKGKRNVTFVVDEKVSVRDYRDSNTKKWVTAFVKKKLGHRTYLCKTINGKTGRFHLNQMQKCENQISSDDAGHIRNEVVSKQKVVDVRMPTENITANHNNGISRNLNNSLLENLNNNSSLTDLVEDNDVEDINIGNLFLENTKPNIDIRPKRIIKAPTKLNL